MNVILLLQIMFYSFLIGFSGAITPGPVLTAVIKETPLRGWKAGPLIVVGHSIIELALLVGLILGLDVILSDALAEIIISFIGGILLCVLAILMLIDVFIKKVSITEKMNQPNAINGIKKMVPIRDGIILSVSNPFWIVWWATIGLGLIYTKLPPLTVLPIDFGILGMIIFYIGHIASDFTWYSFVSVMIATGKKWINDKVYRIILFLCTAFLIYLGIQFIINGLVLWI
ncbi:MAG: LysE family transporter [Candidatus Helarchaeota archaeon]